MKRLFNLKNIFSFLMFSFLMFSFNNVSAGFADYNNLIIQAGAEESKKQTCTNSCPTSDPSVKYYQLTTGVPFLGEKATKCSCIPVSTGMQFFLVGILKFVLGSVGTISVIIIIIAGFKWSFSAGNKKIISDSQTMIKNAIVGLVMTLTSGLLLQVINPKLLEVAPLKVDPLVIVNDVNSCGYPIDSQAARSRERQLCRVHTDNNFLTNGSNFNLEWTVCDINGANCGESQKLTTSDKKQNSQGKGMPVCTSVSDKYARFSIKIIASRGISSSIKFECATDKGLDTQGVPFAVGTYALCRADGNYCSFRDSAACKVNPNDSGCSVDHIDRTALGVNSLPYSDDQETVMAPVTNKFYCSIKDPNDENYNYNSFEICSGSSCVDTSYQDRYDSIRPQFNSNMLFGIKIKKTAATNMILTCKSFDKNRTNRDVVISQNIINSSGVGSIFNFCVGGWGHCGLRPYDQILWTVSDPNTDRARGDFNCDLGSTSQSICESLKFNNFQACYWDGNSCESSAYEPCLNKPFGHDCGSGDNNNISNLSDGTRGSCQWVFKGYKPRKGACLNHVPVSVCSKIGQNCRDDGVRGVVDGRDVICRNNRCIYKVCNAVGDYCSEWGNDARSANYECKMQDGEDGVCVNKQ